MSKAQGKTREEILDSLAERIDKFESYSTPHSRALAQLATWLARRFGLAAAEVTAIAEAARLHDIGLYAMSPLYHSSPGVLRFEDRLDLWRHSIIGEQEMAKREFSRHAQLLVRWHHEWWNGTGYPDMLAFEDIPIGARLLRAIELYNALTSARPYRAAFGRKEALDALKASAGIECDPYVVLALLALLEEMESSAEEAPPEAPAAEALPPVAATTVYEETVYQETVNRETLHEPLLPEGLAGVGTPTSAEPLPPSPADRAEPGSTASSESPPSSIVAPPHQAADRTAESAPEPAAAVSLTSSQIAELSALSAADGAATATPEIQPTVDVPATADGLEPILKRRILPAPPPSLMPSLAQTRPPLQVDESPNWRGWTASGYSRKTLLAFEASVLRQIPFETVAIAYSGEAKLDWYLKVWGKRILANDTRGWAAAIARAVVESREALNEGHINQLLRDVYVPGTRLQNRALRRWFQEMDCWWMENLRRNVETLDDESLRAQALLLGMQTGDYALSFNDATADLRRPLATVFWRLAGRWSHGGFAHPYNRVFHLEPEEFIQQARADLLYLNLPASQGEPRGAEARAVWRECWVTGKDESENRTPPQTKQGYLKQLDRLLRAAAHIRKWAIGCQEIGLTSARDLVELVKEHRAVRTTYSKDVTEVAGGLRSYIIVAEK